MKSPNQNKNSVTSSTRAEYTAVNTHDLLVKFLDRNKSFIAYPSRAADYTTMNTVEMIVMSPKSGKNLLTLASTKKLIMQ